FGLREVDLVERGDDREVGVERGITGGERLGLDPLTRVDEQDGALARGEAARHLVREVDVPRGVDEVQDVVLPLQSHVLRLDRDPALALEVHRVEVLLAHVARVDRAAQLEDPVSQGGFAMVDVREQAGGTKALERCAHRPSSLAEHRALVASPGPLDIALGVVHAPMANIKSQIKRNKQNAVRHERNKGVRSELKSRVKAARDAVDGKDTDADDKVRLAQKRLAKAGAKGRIHKNQAARRMSRLMKRASKQA